MILMHVDNFDMHMHAWNNVEKELAKWIGQYLSWRTPADEQMYTICRMRLCDQNEIKKPKSHLTNHCIRVKVHRGTTKIQKYRDQDEVITTFWLQGVTSAGEELEWTGCTWVEQTPSIYQMEDFNVLCSEIRRGRIMSCTCIVLPSFRPNETLSQLRVTL